MKPSTPLALFALCNFLALVLTTFKLGAHYAGKPYRAWFYDTLDRSQTTLAHVKFTEIGAQQSQTLLQVSYACVALSALGLVFLLIHIFQKKGSIHFPGLRAPQAAQEAR